MMRNLAVKSKSSLSVIINEMCQRQPCFPDIREMERNSKAGDTIGESYGDVKTVLIPANLRWRRAPKFSS